MRCPECQSLLEAPDEISGRRGYCPCGSVFRLPGERRPLKSKRRSAPKNKSGDAKPSDAPATDGKRRDAPPRDDQPVEPKAAESAPSVKLSDTSSGANEPAKLQLPSEDSAVDSGAERGESESRNRSRSQSRTPERSERSAKRDTRKSKVDDGPLTSLSLDSLTLPELPERPAPQPSPAASPPPADPAEDSAIGSKHESPPAPPSEPTSTEKSPSRSSPQSRSKTPTKNKSATASRKSKTGTQRRDRERPKGPGESRNSHRPSTIRLNKASDTESTSASPNAKPTAGERDPDEELLTLGESPQEGEPLALSLSDIVEPDDAEVVETTSEELTLVDDDVIVAEIVAEPVASLFEESPLDPLPNGPTSFGAPPSYSANTAPSPRSPSGSNRRSRTRYAAHGGIKNRLTGLAISAMGIVLIVVDFWEMAEKGEFHVIVPVIGPLFTLMGIPVAIYGIDLSDDAAEIPNRRMPGQGMFQTCGIVGLLIGLINLAWHFGWLSF